MNQKIVKMKCSNKTTVFLIFSFYTIGNYIFYDFYILLLYILSNSLQGIPLYYLNFNR